MFSIDIHKLLNQFQYNPDEPLIFNSGFFLFLFLGFLIIYYLISKTHQPFFGKLLIPPAVFLQRIVIG